MPPAPQIAMKKKAQPARKIVSRLSRTKRVARSKRVQHGKADRRAFQHRAAHQRQDRKSGEHFEVGAEDVFQALGLPGHVIGAEPFDVRARRPDEHSVKQARKRNRGCEWQPFCQPPHNRRASDYSYFKDQMRRRTQLTGLIKLFFTTDVRKLVTLRSGKFRIG